MEEEVTGTEEETVISVEPAEDGKGSDGIVVEEGDETKGAEGAEKTTESGDKTTESGELSDESKEMKDNLSRLENDKKNLQIALHKERQAKKKKTDEPEATLTKEQLLGIMQEHGDDPNILLNVVEEMAKQAAKGVKKSAMTEIESSRRDGDAEQFLQKQFPQIYEDGSPWRTQVDSVKSQYEFEDSPFGDFLGLAVTVLHNYEGLYTQAVEKGKQEALTGEADKNRTKELNANTVKTKKGKTSSAAGLTTANLQVAETLGLKGKALETYKKMISGSNVVSMEG